MSISAIAETDLPTIRLGGKIIAEQWRPVKPGQDAIRRMVKRIRTVRSDVKRQSTDGTLPDADRIWFSENWRLIRTAIKEIRGAADGVDDFLSVQWHGEAVPRPYAAAAAYLEHTLGEFHKESMQTFIEGLQYVANFSMGELWALKPMLQVASLERIATGKPIPAAIDSLRAIAEADWKVLFENLSVVDSLLKGDPLASYSGMDYDSRELYRKSIAELAAYSDIHEQDVAKSALRLARVSHDRHGIATRAAARRAHVGYYLIDDGRDDLEAAIGYRPDWTRRLRRWALHNPNGIYLLGIEICTFVVVIAVLSVLDTLTPILAGLVLSILPATQAASDFMNNLVGWILPPRRLPKLDFSEGIPEDCSTIVAVPSLLLNENNVRDLVSDLEIRFLANTDPHLYFALLTDMPDAPGPTPDEDALVDVCVQLIRDLNERYGSEVHTPFYLFHRHRVFNAAEGAWMGWERKRGKLLDLNQVLRGGVDSFPVKVGNTQAYSRIRYVITLDADTQLPRDSAHKLVGALAHPLNRAVVDPETRIVIEGYGILQPRIGISIQSVARSRLANLYSGQTGFDIYTRAVSDVYQDLFGEGIFTGKGIYEIDPLREVLERRFPDNQLLSHDLIEGAYARAALVSDIEFIDDYPSHFSAYSRRKHRWVRGDWQILRWLFPNVPDSGSDPVPNPTTLISRWKMLDNARRSLLDPATLLLFLAGWLILPGGPQHWTGASLILLSIPVYASLYFSILGAPMGRGFTAWFLTAARGFGKGHLLVLLQIVFLLHQALLSLDAIARSLLRTYITKRNRLEWETAAESESSKRKSTVDVYLEWSPVIATGFAVVVWLANPLALPVAAPILLAWLAAPALSWWLNRPPRSTRASLTSDEETFLRDSAKRTWDFFRQYCTAQNNWLIPDNVAEGKQPVERLSPTNAGFLLNANVAAVHLGYWTVAEFAAQTRRTLETLNRLPRYRGHFWNWYDNATLRTLDPPFISTVDSGNLAACLWTLKGAADSFNKNSNQDLAWISSCAHRLAEEMDFSFLYDSRRKLLSIGYDTHLEERSKSCYDLLASESRIAAFIAIAKGDTSQESWFHLGRQHTLAAGRKVLVSWTGTMFEYLMPRLWMRHYTDTLLERTVDAAVAVQRSYASAQNVPWGISESASAQADGDGYGYAAFGIPALSLKTNRPNSLVISPYSTFLALASQPKAAIENLMDMAKRGWTGENGFIESIDYGAQGTTPHQVRMYMSHHQGMALLAACNLLCNDAIQNAFHAHPRVLATELLLHERVPRSMQVEAEEDPPPEPRI